MKLRQKRDKRQANPFFGLELTKLLLEKGVTQHELAKSIGKGDQWIGDMMHGGRSTPPTAVESICSALGADEQTRYRLHIAAARDCGYRIPVFI